MKSIDLRSDTVTVPTELMRRAMAEAEVGDDVIDVDPTVDRLQRVTAERLGKEAALFVPSGTMANQIAVRLHCRPGDELVCEATSHVYYFEQGAYAQLSGVAAKTLSGDRGVLAMDDLRQSIWPCDEHFVRTRLLWIENTHNMGGGTIQPFDLLQEQTAWAGSQGLVRHLDGARLWNAAVASGISEAQWSSLFDTVSVCYSKGLGAPVGSSLAGPADLMAEARRHRKVFGGGMRQAGVIAAAALYALQHHRDGLAEDHEKAQILAEAIRKDERLELVNDPVETNIVYFRLTDRRTPASDVVEYLDRHGVRVLALGETIRAVTHRDVSIESMPEAVTILQRALDATQARRC